MSNAVTHWFGQDFHTLHPLLQYLHRQGGELSGDVTVSYGTGLAGIIGKRIGKKLGIPQKSGRITFKVSINHSDEYLYWNRVFDNQMPMNSIFQPIGHYPDGTWRETTGKVVLELGVKIVNGGWFWVQKKVSIAGISVPKWLMPNTTAYKTVEQGQYHFVVSISLPLLGKAVGYEGDLEIQPRHE